VSPRTVRAVGALAIVALVSIAYSPVIGAGFVWDDDQNVTDNATLRSLSGLGKIWSDPLANQQYYPLTHTSFWLEYHAWGLNPTGYHVTNVVLHALVAVLLWEILQRVGVRGAWAIAAIFGLHPVHVESVAWVTERKNVLSGVWYMIAVLAWLAWQGIDERPHGAAARPGRRWYYAASIAAFALALLSKTATSMLAPAMLLLLWWKRDRMRPRDLLALVPYFALGAGAGALTAWLEVHHVNAAGSEFALPFWKRVLVAGRAFWFYIGKELWPHELVFVYPRWNVEGWSAWHYAWPAAAAGAIAAAWALRRKVGKGPAVALLFYGVTVFPALGFFNVAYHRFSFVQDHFQYLASIGIISLVVGAFLRLADLLPKHLPAWSPKLVLVLVLVALGARSARQCLLFRDYETLLRDSADRTPDAYLAAYNLGLHLQHNGRVAEAVPYYRQAVAVRPQDPRFHNNLGIALVTLGQVDEGADHLRLAAQAATQDPMVALNYASACYAAARWAEAVAAYEEALRRKPNWALAERNLAWLLASAPADDVRDGQRALAFARLACEHTRKRVAVCLETLAAATAETGDFDGAADTARKALEQARREGEPATEARLVRQLASYTERKPIRSKGAAEPESPAPAPSDGSNQ
jgi:tetratricopeptide (TPR) repeat protein